MKTLSKTLFGILLTLMWLPLVQTGFVFFESAPLQGAITTHAKPMLNDSTWFAGIYQKEYELYINDTIGYHHAFIRLRNQIDYSLFKKCHSYDIEVGKNGYLIATTHIDAHLGKLHTTESKIDSNVFMLKQLNDTLLKLNKTLVLLFAPSRGAFYKDLSPYWYDLRKEHESDYECYLRLLNPTNIKIIDYNRWFLESKDTTTYPLFTKCGIHWSTYGAVLAADSLVCFIEKERQLDLPDIVIDSIELSNSARHTDADLNSTLNLIWPVKNNTMAYPNLSFKKSGKDKLKFLVIGDSFFFNIGATNIPPEVFEEYSFWYYNSSIFSNGNNNGKNTREVNLQNEINKHDVIALIATEVNLNEFGWGFIKNSWETYFYTDSERVKYYVDQIKNNTSWYEQIIQKAKQNNNTVEIQITEDAKYLVWKEKQENVFKN
ncbi:MAG: hypothetical protein KA444_05150 [Bacteroidia bacterium]|nr:hypothetical protein [Bacteroidia bacterium]